MKPLIALLLTLVFAVTLFAQREEVTVETDLPPTLVPAEKLPLPDYPEAAKNAGLRGRVSVDVTLNNEGWVLTAENPRGPYPVCQSVTDPAVMALRNSAFAAAKKARFQARDGQSTLGMKGRITYNFESNVRAVELPVGKGRADRLTVIGIADTGARVVETGQAVIKDSKDTKEMRMDPVTRIEPSDTGVRVVAPGEPYPEKSVDASPRPKMVSGGVLNGRANTLAKPSYPPAAKAVRASGSVAVQVLITEDGIVYSARTVSGHPLLRSSSEIAACSSKFPPTFLEGNPVKVSGVITYNYVP